MSFYTALTGLNAATAQLAVTSNNIANVGTAGFKRSRADFGDIFATSPLQQASSVVGQGVSLKQVSQEFSQGNISVSSNALDLAITGDGFFPLKSGDGLQNIYTRNGSFTMNDQYNVVNSAGQALMAATVDSSGKADLSNLIRLTIPKQTSGQAKETSLVDLGLNLPADAQVISAAFNRNNPSTYNKTTAITVYDKGGNNYLATVYYVKTQNASQATPNNRWQTHVYIGDTQVDAALIQATDPNSSAYYVNKYGQLATKEQIGSSAISSNTTTQMFTLDQLTDKRPSVPAAVGGVPVGASAESIVPPISWDLTADNGLNFTTLTDNQKLSLKNLFKVDIDGSGNPVTVDLSGLANLDKKMNGSAIADYMSNVINQKMGDDRYFDFSAGASAQKFSATVGGQEFGIDLSAQTKQIKVAFSSGDLTGFNQAVSVSQLATTARATAQATLDAVIATPAYVTSNAFVTSATSAVATGQAALDAATVAKTVADAAVSADTTSDPGLIAAASDAAIAKTSATTYLTSVNMDLTAATTARNALTATAQAALTAAIGTQASASAAAGNTAIGKFAQLADSWLGSLVDNNDPAKGYISKRSIESMGDGVFVLTGGPGDGNLQIAGDPMVQHASSVTDLQPFLSEKQKIVFSGSSAAGLINVNGKDIEIAKDLSAAQVADTVRTALIAQGFLTDAPGRSIEIGSAINPVTHVSEPDGSLIVQFAQADGNPDPVICTDINTTGALGRSYVTEQYYGQLAKLTSDDAAALIEKKMNLAISQSSDPAVNNRTVAVSYDRVNQGFKFIESTGESITLHGGQPNQPTTNAVLGLTATDATTDPLTGFYMHASETLPNGGNIRKAPLNANDTGETRFGSKVVFDSVNLKFAIQSGATGDASSVAISDVSEFAKNAFGLSNSHTDPVTTDAVRGIASQPAQTAGTQIAINVNNNFGVDATTNQFTVTVDGVKGDVFLPINANYTLDGFISELQKRINTLADDKGNTVSGVTVGYDRIKNALTFTSGTTGSDSFIQVSGSATWGLLSGPSGRGQTTSWIKPTQYTDYSSGQPQKKYINNLGVETSSADGYAGLPEWSPIFLEKGELTFDTSGKLLSPLSGAQLDTVFLPDGKGSLTININYSKSTQYSSPFAVLSQSQDGAPEGEMVGVSIGDDGLVNASYSNGSQKSLGKIVLVNFTNPSGLRQIGGSSYYSSSSSGTAKYGEAGGAGFGTIRAGATERANVDLTQELVDLITEQRNFQASAKAIETSSSLTQTITNIRN